MKHDRENRERLAEIIARGAAARGIDLSLEEARAVALADVPPPPPPAPPPPRIVNRPLPPAEVRAQERAKRREGMGRLLLAATIASRPRPPSPARVRFLASAQSRPGCENFGPLSFEASAFALVAAIMRDVTGLVAAAVLDELPRAFKRAVTRAALCDVEWHGEFVWRGQRCMRRVSLGAQPVRTLRSATARRRVAFAAVLYRYAESSDRRGFCGKLEGFARGTWGVLAPSLSSGEHVTRRTLDADWQALRLSRAVHVEQPPAHRAKREYVGRDREGRPRALAVYYLPTRMVGRRALRAAREDAPPDDACDELVRPGNVAPSARVTSERRCAERPPRPPPDVGALYAPKTF